MKDIVSKILAFLTANLGKIFIGTVLLFGLLFAYEVFHNKPVGGNLIGKDEKYQQLNDRLAEMEVKYRDQIQINEKAQAEWATEKDKLLQEKKAALDTVFSIRNGVRNSAGVDHVGTGVDGKRRYIFHELHFAGVKDKEDGPAIGYVMIYEDGHVVSKVYRHHIVTHTIMTRDPGSGRYRVLTKGEFVLDEPGLAHRHGSGKKDWTGVPYALNVVGGTATIDPREDAQGAARFRFWNPRFDAGVNIGTTASLHPSFVPNLGFSVSSYGKSKTDNDFRFFRVGVGGSSVDGVQVNAAPIVLGLGRVSSMLSNSFIAPTVAWNSKTGLSYGMNFSLGF